MDYLSIKSLHIILVTSWFAGLFYLPRLFVNHAMVSDKATLERLALMELKLYRFMTPLGILAVGLGMWLWFGFGFSGGWLHLKPGDQFVIPAGFVGQWETLTPCRKLYVIFEPAAT